MISISIRVVLLIFSLSVSPNHYMPHLPFRTVKTISAKCIQKRHPIQKYKNKKGKKTRRTKQPENKTNLNAQMVTNNGRLSFFGGIKCIRIYISSEQAMVGTANTGSKAIVTVVFSQSKWRTPDQPHKIDDLDECMQMQFVRRRDTIHSIIQTLESFLSRLFAAQKLFVRYERNPEMNGLCFKMYRSK